MRKIVGTVFQSLDGVMQAPGGPSEDPTDGFALGGWQFGFPDEEAGAAIGPSLMPPYSLLLGRRTYDIFASYWPYHDGQDKEIADDFNAAEKFVMTRHDAPLDWAGSRRVSGFDALAEIKQGDGPDLQIWGSSTLYPGLIERGMLDRLTILTYPVVLGSGKRTFAPGSPPTTLRFESGKTTSRGTAVAVFVPELCVATGESPAAKANAHEAKRQQAIAEGKW
ncbi:dihydrofolate reductase family protein [Sphingomonas jaspsi]|uniref:dihydrofolate reductase family protein n=1 Tax=Sphingomonas jaspsi TaxID=392409 RepID=UPI0004B2F713|nr:dihydrofolate reductase family protein [Sphingomonas jaspsi]